MTEAPNWDVLPEFKAFLEARGSSLAAELRGLWQRYQAGAAQSSPEGFLDVLLAEGRIDPLTHARFAARASLDLNEPPTLCADAVTVSEGEEQGESAELDLLNYDLLGSLGEGGMGVVSLARDVTLRRRVALKTLRRSASPQGLARFVREAQITAQLDHPYVVPVYAFESSEKGVAYAMKLVRGRTLGDLIARAREQREAGALDEDHALPARLEAFLKVCDAVAFAHERGVIHRDLKPDNVMLGAFRELYVLDWGLARVLEGNHAQPPEVDVERAGLEAKLAELDAVPGAAPGATLDGDVLGTPAYMAPEQAAGQHSRVGPRSDQCSLGLILYELVNLEPPFPAPTVIMTVLRALDGNVQEPARPPHPELAAIVARATALKPEQRYGTVAELADDVRRHLRGAETQALPDGPRQRLARWTRAHQGVVLAAAISLVLLGAGVAVVSRVQHERALERREQSIAQLSNRVGRQAQRLSSWLGHYQGLSQELAGATAQALLDPRLPEPRRQYRLADFADPERRPPDVAESERYGRAVSTAAFLAHVAPDAAAGAEDALRRLVTLVDRVGSLYRITPQGQERPPKGMPLGDWIRSDGPSVHWVTVASARGAIAIFPGSSSGWTKDYDPTKRSWYRAAIKRWEERGVPHAWTRPYLDRMSGSLVVSSVSVCLDLQGNPIGTAALDLPLADLQEHLWQGPLEGLERVYLLETGDGQEDGAPPRVLLRSDADASKARRGEELDLGAFPYPEALERLHTEDAGVVRIGERLICWQKIAPVGFALVAIVDAESTFSD